MRKVLSFHRGITQNLGWVIGKTLSPWLGSIPGFTLSQIL